MFYFWVFVCLFVSRFCLVLVCFGLVLVFGVCVCVFICIYVAEMLKCRQAPAVIKIIQENVSMEVFQNSHFPSFLS